MRVFTRSIGNVATQPAIPARPPARKSADQGILLASESISDNNEEWSAAACCADGGLKYRHVASYCSLVVHASSTFSNERPHREKIRSIPRVSQCRGSQASVQSSDAVLLQNGHRDLCRGCVRRVIGKHVLLAYLDQFCWTRDKPAERWYVHSGDTCNTQPYDVTMPQPVPARPTCVSEGTDPGSSS